MAAGAWTTPTLAVLLVAAFGLTIGGWTRHVDPRWGARILLATSAMTTIALTSTLAMLALPLVGQNDALADYAHWSNAVFARGSVPGRIVAILAAATIAALAVRAVNEGRVQRRARVAARALRRQLRAATGEVVIAASDNPDAMAVSSDLIVMTTGLVRVLDAEQRRAVLTHERAHLRHRHHRYLQVAGVLTALNPLLFRVPDALSYLTERWADEEAARATSRQITASALERIAVTTHRRLSTASALRAATVAVELRIAALRDQPPLRWSRLLLPVLTVASLVVVLVILSEHTIDVVQLATTMGRAATPH